MRRAMLQKIGNSCIYPSGMVRHYRFDELSGTTCIEQISGVNGTYTGGYTLGVSAIINTGVLFNGSAGYVDLPSSDNLGITVFPFTIKFWVNPSTITGGSNFIFESSNPTNYQGVSVNLLNDDLRVQFGDGSGTSIGDRRTHSFDDDITLGWQQIFIVCVDKDAIYAYRNGVALTLDSLTGTATTISFSPVNYKIAFSSRTSNYFNGAIDDFMVWDVALTSTEITDMYNCEAP